MSGTCEYPATEPYRGHPGYCDRPATRAVPLGQTGRHLPVCEAHAGRYKSTIPLDEVPDP